MKTKKVNVSGLGRLPAFCHAVIAGDFIYVSGAMELVEGGTGAETSQALQNIGLILKECGASFSDLVKVSVFLADIKTFPEMNDAYLEVIGSDPPARITVGGAELARGAAVEIDAVAYKPHAMSDGITETQ
jgi:2-iminobutanoate/2-iminopropanoate deaminase